MCLIDLICLSSHLLVSYSNLQSRHFHDVRVDTCFTLDSISQQFLYIESIYSLLSQIYVGIMPFDLELNANDGRL